MASSNEEIKKLREELTWLDLSDEQSFSNKARSRGWGLYLVPIGCVVTVGVLARGLHHMFQKDCKKQQMFMRYRILAQGVTIAVALTGMLQGLKWKASSG